MRVFRAPDVPQMILTDPKRMKQVFINLFGNSLKFTRKGHITLRVSCDSFFRKSEYRRFDGKKAQILENDHTKRILNFEI